MCAISFKFNVSNGKFKFSGVVRSHSSTPQRRDSLGGGYEKAAESKLEPGDDGTHDVPLTTIATGTTLDAADAAGESDEVNDSFFLRTCIN